MNKRLLIVLLTASLFTINSKDLEPDLQRPVVERKPTKIDYALFASTNTVKGVPITPENILDMASKMAPAEYAFIQASLQNAARYRGAHVLRRGI